MNNTNKIYDIYLDLISRHGDPCELWPQWCSPVKDNDLRELIAVGAILVQRTSWRNAEKSLKNLKANNLISLENLAKLKDLSLLTDLIRPAGFYQTKPKRLIEFAKFVINKYGKLENMLKVNSDNLREELLSVYGVGPETADTLLLFVLDKPHFIIDEYTKRFISGKNVNMDRSSSLKELFETSLPKESGVYQNYHILMIIEQKGKDWCVMETV